MELRKSIEAKKLLEEAAEKAAADAAKGGKKSTTAKDAKLLNASPEISPEDEAPIDTSRDKENEFKSQDDDPSKNFEFIEFQKIMS